ncbi:FMN-dependent NADH-azoreductase [Pelagibaculum spongiae]|uniref:FMN dependent NADH:quinone oxidoreductase n=1 Tax=Pelagibaculum spongiae TaxID=2080658 RepID=A0A2V1GVV5_9GAMM|nr:NAD(P)H-dependent oxidoreductase [Pelagibaculum spongiae]PVZ70160.1 FMN-dependent NADH-azoreductase [Pelagibaculum spongiae]
MGKPINILAINSSARKNRSITREMVDLFLEQVNSKTQTNIVNRDVGMSPPSFINENWIAAAFTDKDALTQEQKEILSESDSLINEIKSADIIVIGAPMYNYSMPASLKAWFDQIARVGLTFSFDLSRGDQPIEPILIGKQLVVLSSRGEFDFAIGKQRAHLNGLDPALSACAHYLGASANEMKSAIVEYEEFKDHRWETSVKNAKKEIKAIAENLVVSSR